jgi:hypothetical protein
MIELYLSSDGKHTVHLSAETPEKMAGLLPKAKALYGAVVRQYGTKAQMWRQVTSGQAAIKANSGQETQAPVCPIHNRRMVYRQGRYGAFWSCPARTPSGRWCPVTKDASAPGNGQTTAHR